MILSEEWMSGTTQYLLLYHYDANGQPIGMSYRRSTYAEGVYDHYLFIKNIQGDITGIMDEEGNILVTYAYDAWGNHISTVYSNGGGATGARYNPFRYRGYYYDSETGLYYLNSRYYDPASGRFISPDGQLNGGLLGYNLFAYCENNPVNYCDPNGNFPIVAFTICAAIIGMGLTFAGVAFDCNTMTAIGLTMVASSAVISGGLAVIASTNAVTTIIGAGTIVAGFGSSVFVSAEYQEAVTGNNWMLDNGMSEGWYNGLMIGTTFLATIGTIASSAIYALKVDKILKVGRISGVRAEKGYPGIRFTDKSGAIRSLEIHPAHQNHGVHLQINNWWVNHQQYTGQYYRAFAKHFEILKFWKGWY